MLLAAVASVHTVGQSFLPLRMAAMCGLASAVQLLLDAGAGVDVVSPNSYTLLHLASFQGHDAIIQVFLPAGASVHAVGQ